MFRQARTGVLAVLAGLMLSAVQVAAQTPSANEQPQPAGQSQGPMVVEPLANRLIAVPDVRWSEVNGRSATLVGGYGGLVVDGHLLVGGGGYWLANNSRDRELFYVGGVVGWYLFGGDRLDVSVMSLIGAGDGTAGYTFNYGDVEPYGDVRFGGPHDRPTYPGTPATGRYIVRQNFFIAEPSVSVVLRFARNFGISGSVGYRLVGGAGSLNDEFKGVSGSVGVVFGGGK